MYEKGKGIDTGVFTKVLSIKNITKESLKSMNTPVDNTAHLTSFRDVKQLECDVYKLNVFETSKENFIKPYDLIQVLKYNLNQIESLEEGDIISFERSFYHHHALLTGYFIK